VAPDQLADRIEHDFELGVVLSLQRSQLAREVLVPGEHRAQPRVPGKIWLCRALDDAGRPKLEPKWIPGRRELN
jgi:hypothetical protein